MAKLELDTVVFTESGESIQDAAHDVARDTEATFTVVTEEGPGGGHPVVRFEGTLPELVTIAARYTGVNEQDISNLRMYVQQIKE